MLTYEDYTRALQGAGPKLTGMILGRADGDPDMGLWEHKGLVETAWPGIDSCATKARKEGRAWIQG